MLISYQSDSGPNAPEAKSNFLSSALKPRDFEAGYPEIILFAQRWLRKATRGNFFVALCCFADIGFAD